MRVLLSTDGGRLFVYGEIVGLLCVERGSGHMLLGLQGNCPLYLSIKKVPSRPSVTCTVTAILIERFLLISMPLRFHTYFILLS